MACEGLLTDNILNHCENAMVAGLEVDVLFFNTTDINRVATTFHATKKTLMTNFALKAGKTGLLIEGIKQVNALKSELVKKEMSQDKWKNTFAGVILQISTDNKERLLEMSQGANLAVVVQLKWKGANSADAFQLAGFDCGLELQTATWASNENDGTWGFELASVEGYEETRPLITILDTDYATTLTAFNNKFASA